MHNPQKGKRLTPDLVLPEPKESKIKKFFRRIKKLMTVVEGYEDTEFHYGKPSEELK